jgi:opacity protein-like surface antigen
MQRTRLFIHPAKKQLMKSFQRRFIRFLSIVFLISPLLSLAQSNAYHSRYEATKHYMNGWRMGVGLTQGSLLNPKFSQAVQNGQIRINNGFNYELAYTMFPVNINLTHFSTQYNLSAFEGQSATAYHIGNELGISVALIHSLQYFYPYLGIGYQKTVLGIWVSTTENEPDKVYSVKAITGSVLKLGACLKLSNFEFKAEYRTRYPIQADTQDGYNLYSIQLFYKF